VSQPAWFKVQGAAEGAANPNSDEIVEVEAEMSTVP
jgi:hypothetical protein